jgi:hypothetical protein
MPLFVQTQANDGHDDSRMRTARWSHPHLLLLEMMRYEGKAQQGLPHAQVGLEYPKDPESNEGSQSMTKPFMKLCFESQLKHAKESAKDRTDRNSYEKHTGIPDNPCIISQAPEIRQAQTHCCISKLLTTSMKSISCEPTLST